MKDITIAILLAIPIWTNGQSNEPITKSEQLIADTNIVFKHFDDVQVFQFYNNDSDNCKIAHSKKLDSNGNVIAEYFKDYKMNHNDAKTDILTIYEYNDKSQLLISTSYYETFQIGVVMKTFYYYCDSLLIREETFKLIKRAKSDVNNELKKSNEYVIFDEGNKKESIWKIERIVLFQYDSLGRRKLRYLPLLEGSYNTFEYQYDLDGKLLEARAMNMTELIYTISYEYQLNKVISNFQWNSEGLSNFKIVKEYDNNGNLIKESTIGERYELVNIYEYNTKGQLVCFKAYDNDGNASLTHFYFYKIYTE